MKKLSLILILLISIKSFTQQKPNYPNPENGMKRVDLLLPKIENSKNYKVEIRFGMEISVSECDEVKDFNFNIKNLKEEHGIPPYRFPYYVLPKDIATEYVTLKNDEIQKCDKNKKIKKQVLSSQNIFEEYNEHFAVPYYIPENWTLQYRLWKINTEYKNAEN